MKRKKNRYGPAVKQLQAAEKAMNTALISLNDHKKNISKHFNVRVGSDANEIYRGFLKKKGSGTGFGGIGGRRNWKERLFVLVAPEIGKNLCIFELLRQGFHLCSERVHGY